MFSEFVLASSAKLKYWGELVGGPSGLRVSEISSWFTVDLTLVELGAKWSNVCSIEITSNEYKRLVVARALSHWFFKRMIQLTDRATKTRYIEFWNVNGYSKYAGIASWKTMWSGASYREF
ncbi:hypothetical protein BpHYR1_007189 [Brachionus plicatilis]|uniref:Uncharacterized protein n=1 Tax=Brachionus plicatilis TaxID=10195 RepID=A0A3M7QXY3_BRAPC|nr:hypothetical protein BpHYR1_007189 [Brachionus plicatilis]